MVGGDRTQGYDFVQVRRWRMARLSRWGCYILATSTGVLLVLVGIASSDVVSPILGMLVAFGAWRFFVHPSLQLTQNSLIIVNPIRRLEVGLAEIADISSGYSGLEIRLRDGRMLTAWAVQRTNAALVAGRETRSDRIADIIQRAVTRSAQN